jgi:hypothetical protein
MRDVGMNAEAAKKMGWLANVGAAPYVATVFLSASLVFLVQPMFAKMATPLLGGAPAVWNVSLVCFQAALLAGYAYAHLLARVRSVKTQVIVHAALLLVAALALPLSISTLFGTPDPSQPVLWLAGTFLVSIAPPFAIISATAPLIQNWYARSGRPDAADPYHLYAASNVGSLVGLAAYPLLIEPLLSLPVQTHLWALGYGVLSLCLITSGTLAFRSSQMHTATTAQAAAHTVPALPAAYVWRERMTWLLLAAVPSGLLLGVSTHISTDVAAAPFLWAPPLMAYIATFIIVFSKTPLISTKTVSRYLPHIIACAIGLIATQSIIRVPLVIGIGVHVLALFMVSLCLHGRMADLRPQASRLTEFYLLMSAGGVIGAAIVALLAPVTFKGVWEYPLMLGAALLLRPSSETILASASKGRVFIAAILVFAGFVVFTGQIDVDMDPAVYRIGVILMMAIAILGFESRVVPVAALTGALFIGWTGNPAKNSVSERGFFGVVKTVEWKEQNLRLMMHGTTLHGAQRINDSARPTPLTYYHDDAPIGQAFIAMKPTAKTIGVVGLGVGSVACHAAPGQSFTYYEIDPLVADVARDASRFTFLSTCTPDAPIVLGDARVTLGAAETGKFDVLLLDAFSSDAVPAHLLTREAMALYLSRLSENGVLIFHISNRHLALMPTLARVGAAEGAVMISQNFNNGAQASVNGPIPSDVVVLARTDAALAPINANGLWEPLTADNGRAWSDAYSNVIGAMIERHRAPKAD